VTHFVELSEKSYVCIKDYPSWSGITFQNEKVLLFRKGKKYTLNSIIREKRFLLSKVSYKIEGIEFSKKQFYKYFATIEENRDNLIESIL
jgi:hypothetical protein